MADDGMLINFNLGDGPFKQRARIKGGSWKDRLTAKKAALHNRAKNAKAEDAQQSGVAVDSLAVSDDAPPTKRARLESTGEVSSTSRSIRVDNGGTRSQPQSAKAKPREVISSLFSFNPEPKTGKEAEAKDDGVEVQPSNAPISDELQTFTSLGLSIQLAEHLLRKMNIQRPTSVQREAVTQLLKEDTDAFIQAETGSGKTLAYLLPIVQRIMSLSAQVNIKDTVHRDSGLFAIVIVPTHELSKQISGVLESLLRCAHWIVSGIVIGGEKKKSEKARLRKGLNILIATPGRLADHLDHTEVLDVSNVRWLVLDEADRLMEMGFEQDIAKILSKLDFRSSTKASPKITGLPNKRTTVLCSATMKMSVQKLGEMSLKDAVHIQASKEDIAADGIHDQAAFAAPTQLKQSYAIVPAKLRLVCLTAFLKRAFSRRGSVMRAIVFMSCADSVDFHYELFSHNFNNSNPSTNTTTTKPVSPTDPLTAAATAPSMSTSTESPTLSTTQNPTVALHKLHGSLPQPVRTATLASFARSVHPALLLCTDVASRGLDLPAVDLVIEFDPPATPADHVHRVGRTARAGRPGRALIFLQPGPEETYLDVLRTASSSSLTRHEADDMLSKGFPGAGKEWEVKATEWQLGVERWCLEDAKALEMARRAFQSHVRAYATHVAGERHIFEMRSLHLGHLAKAFGLRDRPGSIKVPGLRPDSAAARSGKGESRAGIGGKRSSGTGDGEDRTAAQVDAHEAARKMRSKMRQVAAGGASEFNLG